MPKAIKTLASNSPSKRDQGHRQRVDGILRQRERLIAEVQNLSATACSSESAKKAQQLLTRWWARADWKAREELLRVAEWVIRVEASGKI